MKSAKSVAPLALSFIFRRILNTDLLQTGSTGVGCTINREVTAEVKSGEKLCVFFNGKEIDFPTVREAVCVITNTPLQIDLTSSLPLGYGFGLSGASSLATLFAVNELLALNIPRQKLIEYAHIAEIKNNTGLGTVGTVSTEGFIVKKTAGIPFNYYTLPFSGKKIFAVIIDKLDTPDILSDIQKIKWIEKKADGALQKIEATPCITLEDILDISYDFVEQSSLITHPAVRDLITHIRQKDGHATMAILGNVILTNKKPDFLIEYPCRELIIT